MDGQLLPLGRFLGLRNQLKPVIREQGDPA